MASFLGLGVDNPVTWANFYRRGGFRTILGTAGAYFAILLGLIYLNVRVNPRRADSAYESWAVGLMALQVLFSVVIASGRVTATIRGDVTSGMMESLRMMPLAARQAIAGYLASTAATTSGFIAANFVLGLLVTVLAQQSPQQWVMANALLLAFALLVWTVSAFMALVIRGAGVVIVGASVVGLAWNVGLLYVAPGLSVLAGMVIGGSVFDLRGSRVALDGPVALSLASQLLIGWLFFAGAARKYRRPDDLALGGSLSVLLLLAWVTVTLLAIAFPEGFTPAYRRWRYSPDDSPAAFCGSTVMAMVLALVPLANLARMHVRWVRGRGDDPELRRGAPPMVVSALVVAAVLSLMMLALPKPPGLGRAACMACAMVGFSASVVFVGAWFYRAVESAKVIIAIWLICYCVAPLGVDLARDRMTERVGEEEQPVLAVAASLSPVGLLIEAATDRRANLAPGAVFHLLAPLLPAGLYLRGRRATSTRRRGGSVARG